MAKINNKNKFGHKPSDKFWKENFMKVLNCLSNEELTWSKQNWNKYGVSIADQKRIEQEFYRWERFQHNKAKIKVVLSGNGTSPIHTDNI